jgi:hypothetical protein
VFLSAEDDSLVLTQRSVRTTNDVVTALNVQVKLGMVQVEASFGSLAWAGMYYPKPRNENTAITIHAQIVGAQVRGTGNKWRLLVLQSAILSVMRV